MEQFEKKIHSITNLDKLQQMKRRIKDGVVEPSLHWKERMLLYKQVQLINQWIATLQDKKE